MTSSNKITPPNFSTIGKYRIICLLAEGGMSSVYKARDPEVERDVAIKIIRTDVCGFSKDETQNLFRSEGRLLGNLRHPNIVTIFEANYQSDTPYIVMELIEGETFESLVKRTKRLQANIAMPLLAQVANALDYAHSRGVIHHDIKSSNIIIDKSGTPFILDFGMAGIGYKLACQQKNVTSEKVFGTPAYMAPELISKRPIDKRSDIFSLACVAFEMLSGELPYGNTSPSNVMENILQGRRRSICGTNSNIPFEVERIFEKGLASIKEDRFSSAMELVQELALAFKINLKNIYHSGYETIQLDLSQGKKLPPYERILAQTGGPQQVELTPNVANPWQIASVGSYQPKSKSNLQRLSTKRAIFDDDDLLTSKIGTTSRLTKVKIIGLVLLFFILPIIIFSYALNKTAKTTNKIVKSTPTAISLLSIEELPEPQTASNTGKSIDELNDLELAGIILAAESSEDRIISALDIADSKRSTQLPSICVKLIIHPLRDVRLKALNLLAGLKERRAISAVMIALHDPDSEVRTQAGKTLQDIGDRKALAYLINSYFTERAPEVRAALKRNIDGLSGYIVSDKELSDRSK